MSSTTKATKGMRINIGVPGNNNTFERDLRNVVVICEASYKYICGVSIYICEENYKYGYGGSNIYICGVSSADICGVNNKFNSGGGRTIALSSADKTLFSGVETIYIYISEEWRGRPEERINGRFSGVGIITGVVVISVITFYLVSSQQCVLS